MGSHPNPVPTLLWPHSSRGLHLPPPHITVLGLVTSHQPGSGRCNTYSRLLWKRTSPPSAPLDTPQDTPTIAILAHKAGGTKRCTSGHHCHHLGLTARLRGAQLVGEVPPAGLPAPRPAQDPVPPEGQFTPALPSAWAEDTSPASSVPLLQDREGWGGQFFNPVKNTTLPMQKSTKRERRF